MADEKAVFDTAMRGYSAAIVEEQAAYQKAQLSGDFDEQVRAGQSIAALRVQAREFQALASEHAASMAASIPANKYGLSETEIDLAHRSLEDRRDMPKLSDDEKERIYAENRSKLHRMRASGEYRQTTDQTG